METLEGLHDLIYNRLIEKWQYQITENNDIVRYAHAVVFRESVAICYPRSRRKD
jgi:hypothetical protein